MALEHAILGFLSLEPMTGYDLKTRCFDDAAGHVWTADQAQIYRTLDRMASNGLVRSRLVPQRGRPDRKLFSISPKGRAELAAWLRGRIEPSAARDPLLLHLLLASDLDDGEIASLLEQARDSYQRRLDRLRGSARDNLDAWETRTRRHREAELRRLTLTAAAVAARGAIDWIDDSLERVRGGLPARVPEVSAD